MPADDNTPSLGRPLIIPLFIPHRGCPHQCIFCNQRTITAVSPQEAANDWIGTEVARYLSYSAKRPASVQIAFYGGTFLGLDRNERIGLLQAASAFVHAGAVDSLRFSTRPDSIIPETLDAIERFPIGTVELGVQSMNDAVLVAAHRGHTAADTVTAARRIKHRGYQLGVQMMVGLPGDDDAGAMLTARRIADLDPDFVRIYPTLVLAGSPLADLYRSGAYRPMPLAAGIALVKKLFLFFRAREIPVVRMGLQASEGLADDAVRLAGPYHPAFGHLVHGEIVLDAIRSVLDTVDHIPERLTITAHPTMVSRVQGLGRRNLRQLRKTYPLQQIHIVQADRLPRQQLLVGDRSITLP